MRGSGDGSFPSCAPEVGRKARESTFDARLLGRREIYSTIDDVQRQFGQIFHFARSSPLLFLFSFPLSTSFYLSLANPSFLFAFILHHLHYSLHLLRRNLSQFFSVPSKSVFFCISFLHKNQKLISSSSFPSPCYVTIAFSSNFFFSDKRSSSNSNNDQLPAFDFQNLKFTLPMSNQFQNLR